MRTKYLKCFLVLAEEQHYHRAAERLNVAQPLLSLAIKRLEAELGLQLFIRTQRSTQITEAGRRLVPDARRVLDTYAELQRNASSVTQAVQRRIRLGLSGMTLGLAHPRLDALLAHMRMRLADIDLYVTEHQYGPLIRGLRDGTLDAGIVMGSVRVEDLVIQHLWYDPMWAVVPATHPLAQTEIVTRKALKSCSLIVCHPENDDGASDQLRAVIAQAIAEPHIAQYASSIPGMLSMVAAGFGISFIAQSQIARNPRKDVRYLPIEQCEATFCTSALYHAGGLRPEDRRFFEAVRDFLGTTADGDALADTH
ncbi:LysR family transcriptional regulator [Bordetella petrii]|uniref:Transcriptional regulator, LysR-family n=1 Tax=Bordetella petrii (strain ATCC BAA-461 / DSM 12804 / CCUG 43448 / CIP 107267 / Se-1111R) TaxID=340100 RepID=A9IF52_BORPD|nr:LysR family transcriptional regulator [Bordetella petrii]MBO1112183.1 LysR family transcriptional regulator [Bordetella petrii]CAP44965.1 transcriptional regulator, LysR-family [Bordetella petrii]